MNLYLDDNRSGPSNNFENPQDGWQNWVIVRSVENAKLLLKTGLIVDISLDHDLGVDESGKELSNGSALVKWMIEENCWPTGTITIHSQNLIAAKNMKADIDRFRPTPSAELCRCGGEEESDHPCP